MAYEFDGEKYRRASAMQKSWAAKIIASLELRGDERVLDLGCGDGVPTAQLAERVPRGAVLGIDASAGMIASAARRSRPNLEFRRMDINAIDFADEFDLIFSNATLHWVADHRRLLGNVLRALRLGGVARFNFAAHGNSRRLHASLREVMGRAQFAQRFVDFDWPWFMPKVQDYRRLVSEFPFREARVWGEVADRTFADAGGLTEWIDQPVIVPFLEYLPESLRQRFRDEVVEGIVERTRQPNGTFAEEFRRVNLLARK